MSKTYQFTIVTPSEVVYDGPVTSAVVPGELGYLGIWVDHAPFVTTVVPGTLTFWQDDTEQHHKIGKGFLEVFKNRVTLLTDFITHEKPGASVKESTKQ